MAVRREDHGPQASAIKPLRRKAANATVGIDSDAWPQASIASLPTSDGSVRCSDGSLRQSRLRAALLDGLALPGQTGGPVRRAWEEVRRGRGHGGPPAVRGPLELHLRAQPGRPAASGPPVPVAA